MLANSIRHSTKALHFLTRIGEDKIHLDRTLYYNHSAS